MVLWVLWVLMVLWVRGCPATSKKRGATVISQPPQTTILSPPPTFWMLRVPGQSPDMCVCITAAGRPLVYGPYPRPGSKHNTLLVSEGDRTCNEGSLQRQGQSSCTSATEGHGASTFTPRQSFRKQPSSTQTDGARETNDAEPSGADGDRRRGFQQKEVTRLDGEGR
jgi:hypothetical protein